MERSPHSMEENNKILEFDGPIFQVKADPYSPRLGLEVRHPELRKVEYHWVNLEAEDQIYSSGKLEWWTGLHSIKGQRMVLYHFEDPSLPVYKGVSILELPGFDLKWEHPDARVLAASRSAILLGTDNRRGIYLGNNEEQRILDPSELSGELAKEEYLTYQDRLMDWIKVPEYGWPDQLASSSPISDFPPFRPGASVLSWDDHLLGAWHSPIAEGRHQLLLTYIYKGVTQWTRILHPALDKLNPEPFFMVGDHIIWIAERHQLCWCKI